MNTSRTKPPTTLFLFQIHYENSFTIVHDLYIFTKYWRYTASCHYASIKPLCTFFLDKSIYLVHCCVMLSQFWYLNCIFWGTLKGISKIKWVLCFALNGNLQQLCPGNPLNNDSFSCKRQSPLLTHSSPFF